MFLIKCLKCGRIQQWDENVALGNGTKIEIADKAIYCTCGNSTEEIGGEIYQFINK